jgi:hypothetical protein
LNLIPHNHIDAIKPINEPSHRPNLCNIYSHIVIVIDNICEIQFSLLIFILIISRPIQKFKVVGRSKEDDTLAATRPVGLQRVAGPMITFGDVSWGPPLCPHVRPRLFSCAHLFARGPHRAIHIISTAKRDMAYISIFPLGPPVFVIYFMVHLCVVFFYFLF